MKKIIFVLLAIVLSYSALNAQSFALGPQLGYVKAPDADEATYILGAALRVKFAGFLGAELSGAYKKEEYLNGAVKAQTYPIMLTGLIHFVSPLYVAAGAGWYNTKIEYSKELIGWGAQNSTDSQFGYHIGGGIELPLGHLTLTGDIKYIFLDLDLANLSAKNLKDLKNDFMVISVGALIQLSK